jgi:hypothetical protein
MRGSMFPSSFIGAFGASRTVESLIDSWRMTSPRRECLRPLPVLPLRTAKDKSRIMCPLRSRKGTTANGDTVKFLGRSYCSSVHGITLA